MKTLRLGSLVAGVSVLALVAGCGAKSADHPEELRIIVQRFLTQIELKQYEHAAQSVHRSRRVEFVKFLNGLGDRVTITETRIQLLDAPNEEERERLEDEELPLTANVLVGYKIIQPPSTEVRSKSWELQWTFDRDEGRWLATNSWE